MNDHDYNFDEAVKLCGKPPHFVEPSGECTEDAPNNCKWYEVCYYKSKRPSKPPTKTREYRRPKRQTNVIIHVPGSEFHEKQREIQRRKANSRD